MNLLVLNYIFCISLALFIELSPLGKERKGSVSIYVSFFPLLFFHSMLSVYSLPDTHAYYLHFTEMSNVSFSQCFQRDVVGDFEIGYLLFTKIISSIIPDFQIFHLIYSVIYLIAYYRLFKDYSPYVMISVLLLLTGGYNQSIHVIRQYVAIALCLLSIPYVIKRKIIPYCLLCFLAFSMHQTALLFIPIYFIYPLEKKKLLIVLFALFVILLLSFGNFLGISVNYLVGYSSYIDSEESGQNYKSSILALFYLLIYIISLRKNVFNEGINRLCFIMLFISAIIALCGIGFVPTGRMVIYFSAIECLALPIAVQHMKNSSMKMIIVFVVLALGVYMQFIGSGYENISDYKLFWQ